VPEQRVVGGDAVGLESREELSPGFVVGLELGDVAEFTGPERAEAVEPVRRRALAMKLTDWLALASSWPSA